MRHPPVLRGACLVVALAVCVAARADLVYLTDGTVVEGEVTYVGNMVKIRKTSGITVTHPKHLVRRVVKSVSAAQEYRKRSESVEPDDAKGLVELARWCKAKKLDTEAEAAYRAALDVASPLYRTAKLEFAKLLEGKKRLKEAHRLYSELGPELANDAAIVSARLDLMRAEAYDRGMRRLLERNRREALMDFERALKFTPSGARAGTGMVTEADVLAKISQTRKEFVESIRPPLIDMRPCPACQGTGLGTCKACKGSGRVRRQMMVLKEFGPALEWRLVTCETCKGGGKVRCTSCYGSSIDCRRLDGVRKGVVRAIAKAALSSVKGSLPLAVRRMNRAVTRRRLAFSPREAPYPTSRGLRDRLPGVPATAAEFGKVQAVWRAAAGPRRLNFLANYALESARLLSSFSESAYKEPVFEGVGEAGSLGLAKAEAGDATRISAFPHEAAGLVCRIPCEWREAGGPAENGYRLALAVDTGAPHTLSAFVWKEEARPLMDRLGSVLDLPGLRTRAVSYPFAEVANSVQARKPGDRVALVGRFLYDKEPGQSWCFEVWRIVPRPDEDTERMVAMLSRRVSFRFADTPMSSAVEMLSDLTGVRIALKVPPGAGFRVTARARKVPLGHALERMLRRLDLAWTPGTIDVRSIRVVERVTAQERARAREILRQIPEAGE